MARRFFLVSARLDTVFPRGTHVRVKEREGRLYAPGISDDTRDWRFSCRGGIAINGALGRIHPKCVRGPSLRGKVREERTSESC
jgi:hypothetical protein